MKEFKGNIIDVFKRRIFKGKIIVDNEIIIDIVEEDNNSENYILPGLIDSHVHIESSMLIPSRFAELAIPHGTVAIISDPHEIANVLGKEGVNFMIENAKLSPLKIFYSIPSCVPATYFETSGSILSAEDIKELLNQQDIKILGEMMNYPGVIYEDEEVIKKIKYAKDCNAIIDGHIPCISGDMLKIYINSGISTDHECFTYQEAVEKISLGMKILIREGSAAKNFNTLYPLIRNFNNMCMLCTDDSHPDDMIKYGHIDKLIKKGLELELNLFDLLTVSTINPVLHYNIPVGLLRKGDYADFIVINNLKDFGVLETIINGKIVYSHGRLTIKSPKVNPINLFKASRLNSNQLIVKNPENKSKLKVIEIIDKELITRSFSTLPKMSGENIVSDTQRDILKIVVYNRYSEGANPSIGFISGMGLKHGAIASSIAHDSHNIIAVGVDDVSITNAINEIIENKGGLCFVKHKDFYTIPLEFAGLMTQDDPHALSKKYEIINKQIKAAGSTLDSPFMTLSFMALLVIPELKIGDKGLFDVNKFSFTDLLE